MKWIELIRVRSSAAALLDAMPSIEAQVAQIETQAVDAETLLVRHALYDGDIAAVIVWRDARQPHETREGLMLARRLSELGSVDHAVWTPVALSGVDAAAGK